MFNIIKDVIVKGGNKLAEVQHKVKKLYLLGDITESEMDELLAMASRGASVDAERPETLEMLCILAREMEALNARVKILEGGEDTSAGDYPTWKTWDGMSADYSLGAVVSHNGELWESTFEGQNVWEPGVVDEKFWKRVQNEK